MNCKHILQNDCEWLGNVKEYVKQHGMEVDDIKIQEMLGEFSFTFGHVASSPKRQPMRNSIL